MGAQAGIYQEEMSRDGKNWRLLERVLGLGTPVWAGSPFSWTSCAPL